MESSFSFVNDLSDQTVHESVIVQCVQRTHHLVAATNKHGNGAAIRAFFDNQHLVASCSK